MELTKNGNPKLFTRKEIKQAYMQYGYGQKKNGTEGQLEKDMGEKYYPGMYDVFLKAIDRVVPGFTALLESINGMWNPDWEQVQFTMPDGFLITVKPTTSDWIDFKLFDKLPVTAKVSGVQKEKSALILYVSIIHACDAYVARQMVKMANEQGFDILTIHDG